MDKLEKYGEILQSLILKYTSYKPRYTANEWQPICDKEHGEYLLLKFVSGKNGESKNKYPIFHFRLKNGKVYVEENNTDSDVVAELVESGINKKDLILTDYSISTRKQTDVISA
jgi:XisI protein